MPLYNFRLEAQDGSGHFRQGQISEVSKDEARRVLEEREQSFADFRLTEDRAAELLDTYGAASLEELPAAAPLKATEEEKEPFRALDVRDRAHLNLHRQTKPYKLVKLEKVG